MVKRCSHGMCNSDSRYPERLNGVQFVPFPKPKSNLEKCVRWIKLCGRPHNQLNPENINKNRYICTKHFQNQVWPTWEFPDPFSADPYTPKQKPLRRSPTCRRLLFHTTQQNKNKKKVNTDFSQVMEVEEENSIGILNAACQTASAWVDPLDLITLTAENCLLKQNLAKASIEYVEMKRHVADVEDTASKVEAASKVKIPDQSFSIDRIIDDQSLIKYYTGFCRETFLAIFQLLVPGENCPFKYTKKANLKQISTLSLKDQLLLTFCKLRLNLDLLDLGLRFNISKQSASVIFKDWINYMFLRFGEISIWPHRDVIGQEMPEEYRKEFPTTFAILDCTEMKIEKPSSLKTQSQTYSDYKSTNTLKALVAVDPRGSVIFSSMLFSGAMSDKEIFLQSGLQKQLKHLIDIGYLINGDALMGDKGFNIEDIVTETGLRLNIPPFASKGKQMSEADVIKTRKIAKHRVHVERAIRRIKTFKILGRKIQLSLMGNINQIWYTCSFLTNFMPLCIRKPS